MGRPKPPDCDALLVIHHMYMVVLAGLRLPAPTVVLEGPVDIVGDLDLTALLAHQLLHPLPCGIVDVMRMDRWLGACGLSTERLHLVAVVPLEVARSRL